MWYRKKGKNSPIKIFGAVVIAFMIILSTVTLSSMGITDDSETIRINEIMYDPLGSDSGREWVEIYNRANYAINITN